MDLECGLKLAQLYGYLLCRSPEYLQKALELISCSDCKHWTKNLSSFKDVVFGPKKQTLFHALVFSAQLSAEALIPQEWIDAIEKVFDFLIQSPLQSQINAQDAEGCTAFWRAVCTKSFVTAKILDVKEIDVVNYSFSKVGGDGSVTMFPIKQNNELLDVVGSTVLMSAIENKSSPMIFQSILNRSYSETINFIDAVTGWTALASALYRGQEDIIQLLLSDSRLDVNNSGQKEQKVVNLFEQVSSQCSLSIYKQLVERANAKTINRQFFYGSGNTPLMQALINSEERAEICLNHPEIDVHIVNEQGNTALYYAISCQRSVKIVKRLLSMSLSICDKILKAAIASRTIEYLVEICSRAIDFNFAYCLSVRDAKDEHFTETAQIMIDLAHEFQTKYWSEAPKVLRNHLLSQTMLPDTLIDLIHVYFVI